MRPEDITLREEKLKEYEGRARGSRRCGYGFLAFATAGGAGVAYIAARYHLDPEGIKASVQCSANHAINSLDRIAIYVAPLFWLRGGLMSQVCFWTEKEWKKRADNLREKIDGYKKE